MGLKQGEQLLLRPLCIAVATSGVNTDAMMPFFKQL